MKTEIISFLILWNQKRSVFLIKTMRTHAISTVDVHEHFITKFLKIFHKTFQDKIPEVFSQNFPRFNPTVLKFTSERRRRLFGPRQKQIDTESCYSHYKVMHN